MKPVIKQFKLGNSTITLETGRIARQATGAVLVSIDDAVSVLVTVVAAKQADAVTFSLCLFTTSKRLTQPAAFPAVSSSAKVVLPKKKP